MDGNRTRHVGVRAFACGIALVAAGAVWADGDGAAPSRSGEIDWAARIRTVDAPTERTVVGTLRVRVAWPQEVGLAVGGLVTRLPPSWPCTTACDYRGPTWSLEVATGGATVGAGWATVIGHRSRRVPFLSHVYTAFGFRGVATRTWEGLGLGPDGARTAIGFEGAFSIAGASVSLGAYREISGPDGSRWFVGGGMGWGF